MISGPSGHSFTDIDHIVKIKFSNINDFILTSEEATIPNLKQTFQQVEAEVKSILTVLQAGVDDAYKRENYLIELVKQNTKETVTEIKSEIQTISQQFSQLITDFDNILAKLEAAVNECKQTKRSDNDILMIDVANEVQELDDIKLTYPKFHRLTFISGTNAEDFIKRAFGFITKGETKCTTNQQSNVLTLPKPNDASNKTLSGAETVHLNTKLEKYQEPISTVVKDQAAKPKTTKYRRSKSNREQDQATEPTAGNDNRNKQVKDNRLLSSPTVTHSVVLDCNPFSLEVFQNGTICICIEGESKLKLLKPNGIFEQLDFDISIDDIAIHPVDDELYCASRNSSRIVNVDIHTGKSSVVFRTENMPSCIAFGRENTFGKANHDYVLVGFPDINKINMYTLRGILVKTIKEYVPTHITVSPFIEHVAMVDGPLGTSVFDIGLQSVYRYKGSDQYQPALDERFFPLDAVYDTEGHLLIGDEDNKEVHICKAKTGKLVKTINLTEFGEIKSLVLLPDGILVVGTYKPNKHVYVKYI